MYNNYSNQGGGGQQIPPQQELMIIQQDLQQLTAQMVGVYNNPQAQYQIQQQINARKARANQLTYELQSMNNQRQDPRLQTYNPNPNMYGNQPNMMPGFIDPSQQQLNVNAGLFNTNRGTQVPSANDSTYPVKPNDRYSRGRYKLPETAQPQMSASYYGQPQQPVEEVVVATIPLPGFEIKPFVSDVVDIEKEIVGGKYHKWNLKHKKGVRPMDVICKEEVAAVSLLNGKMSVNDKIALAFEAKELGVDVVLTNCCIYTDAIVPVDLKDDFYKDIILKASSLSSIAKAVSALDYTYVDFIDKFNEYMTLKVINALAVSGTGVCIDNFLEDIDDLEDIINTESDLNTKAMLESCIAKLLKSLEFDVTETEFDFKPNNRGKNFKTVSILETTSVLFIDNDQVWQTMVNNNVFDSEPLLITKPSYGELYDLLKTVFDNDDNYCTEKGTLLMLIRSGTGLAEANITNLPNGFVIK
jgi:hypothetical protein